MPVSVLRPATLNTSNSWGVFSGTFVPNLSDGSDGTAVYNTNGNDEFNVAFDDLSAQASSINSVQASMRYSRSDAVLSATIQQYVRLSGNTTYDAVQSGSGGILGASFNPARPGGGSYFPADINAMTGGAVSASGDPGEEVYCYDLWWTIDWSANNGFFLYLILGALGELGGVALREMPALARSVARRTGIRIKPGELAPALAELRGWPGRRYAF